MKKILITGSDGFIGKHLHQYLSNSYKITAIDRINGQDIYDLDENMVSSHDAVIHLAAQTSVWNTDKKAIVHDNILCFIKLFDICKKLNKRLVWASSSCAFNITSMYGLSKYFDEQYAILNNYENSVGLRFYNVYGKNSREDTLMGMIQGGEHITLYNNGRNKRHFTYISDVCRAIEKALYAKNGIYNVANPEETATYNFVKCCSKYMDVKYSLTNEIREFDKETQEIDISLNNLIDNYISLEDGIKLSLVNE